MSDRKKKKATLFLKLHGYQHSLPDRILEAIGGLINRNERLQALFGGTDG